jgi:hypothetical protein
LYTPHSSSAIIEDSFYQCCFGRNLLILLKAYFKSVVHLVMIITELLKLIEVELKEGETIPQFMNFWGTFVEVQKNQGDICSLPGNIYIF